jgi:hypothetical protein
MQTNPFNNLPSKLASTTAAMALMIPGSVNAAQSAKNLNTDTLGAQTVKENVIKDGDSEGRTSIVGISNPPAMKIQNNFKIAHGADHSVTATVGQVNRDINKIINPNTLKPVKELIAINTMKTLFDMHGASDNGDKFKFWTAQDKQGKSMVIMAHQHRGYNTPFQTEVVVNRVDKNKQMENKLFKVIQSNQPSINKLLP